MVGEVFAGVSALKTAFDIAKGLKDIDDAARRNTAVIELQEKILSAQHAESELLETVSELKKRVAELEAWESEKQRYQLAELAPGVVCYVLKPDMRGGEPPHRLCANCYADGKKSYLQHHVHGAFVDVFKCRRCGDELTIDRDTHQSRQEAYREFGF